MKEEKRLEVKEEFKEYEGIKGAYKIYKPLGDKPYEDLSGMKFHRLTAIKTVGRNKTGRVLWLCECECNKKFIATASELKSSQVKSCGCLSKIAPTLRRENLEGKVFTRWTVIKDEGGKKVFCRCSCGTERWVDRGNLRQGLSVSCGCLRKEIIHQSLTKNLKGMRFGRLLVLEEAGKNRHGKILWKTICDCGNIKIVSSDNLLSGSTKSCGCLKRDSVIERCTIPMINKTFNRLTVLELDHNENGINFYKCKCSCGNTVIVRGSDIRSGNTMSCGCLAKEKSLEYEDLSGRRFGKLVVVKRAPNKKGHSTRWICQCDCGGVIETTRSSLLTGETLSCGCIKSKGEWKVSNILTENNIIFEKQKTYDDLRNKDWGIPRYDFYIPNGNYLIEYDGQQHFKHTNLGWNDEEHFKKVQKRDEMKNEYCRKNNIPLIRIPYTQFEDLTIEDLQLETTKFRVV